MDIKKKKKMFTVKEYVSFFAVSTSIFNIPYTYFMFKRLSDTKLLKRTFLNVIYPLYFIVGLEQ